MTFQAEQSPSMHVLIDGYNLLHQSDLMGTGHGADWLRKARKRLIRAIAMGLPNEELPSTTIVFDRHSKKRIESEQRDPSGIQIFYAVDHPEADDLIEELIARHSHPKQLMVVSSDHRLQTAAKRRGSRYRDSDVWYEQLESGRLASTRNQPKVPSDEKPEIRLTQEELSDWMARFETDSSACTLASQPLKDEEMLVPNESPSAEIDSEERLKRELELEGYNPFPEGYADELWDD